MSIWKFIVPYRDPSLLPRQWRIANGTQKSYKSDANKKAKRRLYEMRRRSCKPSASANWHTSSEREVCYFINMASASLKYLVVPSECLDFKL